MNIFFVEISVLIWNLLRTPQNIILIKVKTTDGVIHDLMLILYNILKFSLNSNFKRFEKKPFHILKFLNEHLFIDLIKITNILAKTRNQLNQIFKNLKKTS